MVPVRQRGLSTRHYHLNLVDGWCWSAVGPTTLRPQTQQQKGTCTYHLAMLFGGAFEPMEWNGFIPESGIVGKSGNIDNTNDQKSEIAVPDFH